ncbi:MAG: bifunctional diguanylate cyclase/phosphodiesterase [Acidimicrobiales bacterium]|jgi:diguanylate cyclase (GGDEF)-like protein
MDRDGLDLSARTVGDGSERGRQLARPRRAGVIAAALLLVGVGCSVLGGEAWSSYAHTQASRTFTSMATMAADAVGSSLQRDDDLGQTARTLVETTPVLTNKQFSMWFHLLGSSDRYPGSFGLMYIENVRQAHLAGFSRQVLDDPPLGLPVPVPYTISPRKSDPPYCLTRAVAVQVVASSGISLSSLAGLLAFTAPDLNYCAMPIGAMLRSSASAGEPAAVPLASLITETPHEVGVPTVPAVLSEFLAKSGLFVTMTPIYPEGSVPTTARARLASVTGWIMGIYQAGTILDPIVQGHRGESATLSYVEPSGARAVLAKVGLPAKDTLVHSFPLSTDGNWVVELAAVPPVSGLPATDQGLAILLGGVILSLLLYFLARAVSKSRLKGLQLIEERTAQLRHQSGHDALTGLPNRALIFDRAEQMAARARRDRTGVAALFIDLDQFKDVNDTFGHAAGDELLRQVSHRFSAVVRETDTVGRLGGDEFVVLVETADGEPDPEDVARDLLSSLREPFYLARDGQLSSVSASIGIASGARDSASDLLRDADIALSEAKARSHGNFVSFHPEMQAAIANRVGLESELREGIRNSEFFLVYQPIFRLEDQTMTGVEALLRWRHPTRGLVMPGEFISTLESTGMILEVGRFVLEEACRQGAKWEQAGRPLTVSVNASGRQLDREDFVGLVERTLAASGLEPRLLTIEITETTLMQDTKLSAMRLRGLKRAGVKLAIDDFGTGYCSLAYLQQFPVDSLKIDRSFVSQMETSAEGAALVRTIVQMGRDLNLDTLAEGIETAGQLTRLQMEECKSGQGYLFARPLAVAALEELFAGSQGGKDETVAV